MKYEEFKKTLNIIKENAPMINHQGITIGHADMALEVVERNGIIEVYMSYYSNIFDPILGFWIPWDRNPIFRCHIDDLKRFL